MELNQRKLKVLNAIVKEYIQTGEPVGSKALVSRLDNTVSSATIRNDMAELTQLGLIEQPHTSAGRVPSQAGYRLYIDNLMEHSSISDEEKQKIDRMLSHSDDPDKLIENASDAMAELTNMAAVTTTPTSRQMTVSDVQLIPIGNDSCVIVLITSGETMKSRLIRNLPGLSDELKSAFGATVSKHIIGKNIVDITMPYVQTLAISLGEFAFEMIPLLIGVYETAKEAGEASLCLKGQANLLAHPEYAPSRIKELLEFMSHRDQVLSLLRRQAPGVSVILGSEVNQNALSGSSIVITRYTTGRSETGLVGLIGPDRMDYSRLISSLEYFALRLGNLLSGLLK
ncbi:MAG: heat-inducible transcription repressor HrcA [Clostridia bacterium]|nr:heat-inducible transcription repressor HrcA [Clostridia bacterium]